MKATVLTSDFAKALTIASRFVSARANLPVLSNIVLRAQTNKLKILATDLEISINTSIGASVSDDGEIAVPARAITEIVANLFSKNIDIETVGEILNINSDGFRGFVNGVNTADYPKILEGSLENATGLDTKSFIPSLNKVLFSVSSDDSRPTLTGVLFMKDDMGMTLVGTDGFRLSTKKVPLENITLNKVIIPKRILSEVSRLFAVNEVLFELREADKQVVFQSGDTTITSRIIEGDFPNFERIIPKAPATTVNVSKDELSKSLKLVSVFARDNANIIKIKVTEKNITLFAQSVKNGTQEVTLDSKVEGSPLEISLNVRYVEEFLNVVAGDSVTMKLTDATTPVVFVDHKDPDFLHVIAPVRG